MNKLGRNSLRLAISLVAALVLCFAMSIVVFAAEDNGSNTQMQVNDNNVNVRPDAGTNGDPVGKAKSGQVVNVLGQKNDSDGKTWYQISYHDDSTGKDINGYIRSDFLSPYQAPAAADPQPAGDDNPDEVGGDSEAPTEGQNEIVGDGSFTPMEGEGEPSAIPENFRNVFVRINGVEITAWTNDRYYIFYAESPSGGADWYVYDFNESLYVRYEPSFMDGQLL